ncbi:MAG: hypothetical protein K5Q68_05010 [Roseococcus sp.]|nr:hypothetical protein [Roseococcus sp.]
MRNALAGLGLALALGCSRPAAALDFTVLNQGGGNIIFAAGAFERGDAARLEAVLRRTPNVQMMVFRSPGGVAAEGLAVGRVIRRAGIGTHLPANTQCASACTYAFLGGRVRTMEAGARYGVHIFSASGNPALLRQMEEEIRRNGASAVGRLIRLVEESSAQLAAQLAYYTIEMGVSIRLLEPNVTTAHADIRWLTARELRDFNVVNAD